MYMSNDCIFIYLCLLAIVFRLIWPLFRSATPKQPRWSCSENDFIIVVFGIHITSFCLDSYRLCPCYYAMIALVDAWAYCNTVEVEIFIKPVMYTIVCRWIKVWSFDAKWMSPLHCRYLLVINNNYFSNATTAITRGIRKNIFAKKTKYICQIPTTHKYFSILDSYITLWSFLQHNQGTWHHSRQFLFVE